MSDIYIAHLRQECHNSKFGKYCQDYKLDTGIANQQSGANGNAVHYTTGSRFTAQFRNNGKVT